MSKLAGLSRPSFEGTTGKKRGPLVPGVITMTTTITVEGMSCAHCEGTVEEAIREVPGVTDVAVDREGGRASVEGDAEPDALVRAVEDAGYSAHA